MLEREGTYVNSERRVQRFYRVSQPEADVPADFALVTRIAAAAGVQLEGGSAMQVFRQLSEQVDVFSGINYTRLSEYEKQVPAYGRDTLYYAGTGYANKLGLGAQLPRQTERRPETSFARAFVRPRAGDLWLVPVTRLYDGGALMRATDLLDQRRAGLDLRVHPSELNRLGLNEGENLCFELEGREFDLPLRADSSVPMQSILVARSSGLPVVLPRIIHPTLSEPQALSKGDGERDDQ